VDLWNTHKIRKQRNRPSAITGQPKFNYLWSDCTNYGIPVKRDLISKLLADHCESGIVAAYRHINLLTDFSTHLLIYRTNWLISVGLDEYLPAPTLAWCKNALQRIGVDLSTIQARDICADGSRLHTQVYLQLRTIVRQHIDSGMEPILTESASLTGGYEWAEANAPNLVEFVNGAHDATVRTGGEPENMVIEGESGDSDVDDSWVPDINGGSLL